MKKRPLKKRPRFTPAERMLRARIASALCNMQAIHAFWSQRAQRFYARGTARAPEDSRRAKRGACALPEDAVYFGTYEHREISAAEVIRDLEDAVATGVVAPQPRAPEPAPVGVISPVSEPHPDPSKHVVPEGESLSEQEVQGRQ